MSIVSAKETSTHTEQCDSCHLWFEGLHRTAGDRFLCRLCLELAGENRAAPFQLVARREAIRR
jgi:hypothetical protein